MINGIRSWNQPLPYRIYLQWMGTISNNLVSDPEEISLLINNSKTYSVQLRRRDLNLMVLYQVSLRLRPPKFKWWKERGINLNKLMLTRIYHSSGLIWCTFLIKQSGKDSSLLIIFFGPNPTDQFMIWRYSLSASFVIFLRMILWNMRAIKLNV